MCGQLCPSPSQIAGLFDHQYLWKESVYALDFLHGNNHRDKIWDRLPILVRCGQVVPLVKSDCRILWLALSSKKSVDIFLIHGVSHQEKLVSETKDFVWVYGQSCFLLNWFTGLFISNITGKNQLIPLVFLHGSNHQGKLAIKTTTLGWAWPGLPLVQLDFRILWSSVSPEGINWGLNWINWIFV